MEYVGNTSSAVDMLSLLMVIGGGGGALSLSIYRVICDLKKNPGITTL